MKVTLGSGSVTLEEFAKLCNGNLIDKAKAKMRVEAICTDSREADSKTVFWTLPGKKDDGEAHLSEAQARGCPCIICTPKAKSSVNKIETSDRQQSLYDFARSVLESVNPHRVAVTGSAGKTTTKEFLFSVLSQSAKVFKTSGNHNSTVGLPLSLLEMRPKTDWAVLEMGMNARGEIQALSELVTPDIAAITNIGSAHIGLLGSQNEILQAKLEILSGMRQNGIFLLNLDDSFLSASVGKNFRTISLSANGRKADFSAKNIRVEPQKTIFDLIWRGGAEKDVELNLPGKQFVYAALFAYAAGVYAGVSTDGIRRGLAEANPGNLRQSISVYHGVTLIEDCYNASPESVIAALETLDLFCRGNGNRGIAVLGDMLELGKESERLHRKIGKRFAKGFAERLYTIGKESEQIALSAAENGVSPDQIFQNPDPTDLSELIAELQLTIKPGDVILIKASRGIAAERVGSALKNFLGKRGQEPCAN
ncbi:MAG: UDP-N-acetylmuramoyl-tripeptide--D-alanyl-D-alanine ligase [Ruminococcaceae bacterium]|nr:UDP-N-acetylmuramoyl-tripeptide--D-alanyl-D-alanine ligase [Oscillospiraceae bacterium]